ncbi:MAG TPA: hypothetical protein VLE72_00555 [Candidatus Saccharimonadales bacterium]|nr:hypothetical protein [Candidatus Saccharimonadales bacterium]
MQIVKRFAMALSVLGIVAMPYTATAANVTIESTTQVANQTAGDTQYKDSVAAKVDDVVKVQVWYHNRQEADSGLVANNLKVKINIPTNPGTNQTITGTVSSDNSNTVTDTAGVTLSLANAHLEYIPGSAYWRHNVGDNTNINYQTQHISDNVVGGGVVLENLKPCFNFEATVTVMARVVANGVSITKQVRKVGDTTWHTDINANAGDTVEYLITFKNEGNTVLNNVIVGDNLPPHETYVNGTTMLKNGANPNGIKITNDNIANGGINVGNYTPGAVGYVWFQVKVGTDLSDGCHALQNVGLVRPQGMNEFFNTATVNVCVKTPPTTPPTPTTPQTPQSNLPQTGSESALAGVTSTGVLGYAVHAYRKSKRSLVDALKNIKR